MPNQISDNAVEARSQKPEARSQKPEASFAQSAVSPQG